MNFVVKLLQSQKQFQNKNLNLQYVAEMHMHCVLNPNERQLNKSGTILERVSSQNRNHLLMGSQHKIYRQDLINIR